MSSFSNFLLTPSSITCTISNHCLCLGLLSSQFLVTAFLPTVSRIYLDILPMSKTEHMKFSPSWGNSRRYVYHIYLSAVHLPLTLICQCCTWSHYCKRKKPHLAERWFVVQSRAAVSMSASSNFKIEGTIDPGKIGKKENCVIMLIVYFCFDWCGTG